MFTDNSQEADWSPILWKLRRCVLQSSIHIFDNPNAWTQRRTQVANAAHFCLQVIDVCDWLTLTGLRDKNSPDCLIWGGYARGYEAYQGRHIQLRSAFYCHKRPIHGECCPQVSLVKGSLSFWKILSLRTWNLMKTKASRFTCPLMELAYQRVAKAWHHQGIEIQTLW